MIINEETDVQVNGQKVTDVNKIQEIAERFETKAQEMEKAAQNGGSKQGLLAYIASIFKHIAAKLHRKKEQPKEKIAPTQAPEEKEKTDDKDKKIQELENENKELQKKIEELSNKQSDEPSEPKSNTQQKTENVETVNTTTVVENVETKEPEFSPGQEIHEDICETVPKSNEEQSVETQPVPAEQTETPTEQPIEVPKIDEAQTKEEPQKNTEQPIQQTAPEAVEGAKKEIANVPAKEVDNNIVQPVQEKEMPNEEKNNQKELAEQMIKQGQGLVDKEKITEKQMAKELIKQGEKLLSNDPSSPINEEANSNKELVNEVNKSLQLS